MPHRVRDLITAKLAPREQGISGNSRNKGARGVASQNLANFLVTSGLPAPPLVPVSSSQAVVGAVLGIGLLRRGRGVRWTVLGRIALGWLVAPIAAGILCFVALFFLQNVFNQEVYRGPDDGINEPDLSQPGSSQRVRPTIANRANLIGPTTGKLDEHRCRNQVLASRGRMSASCAQGNRQSTKTAGIAASSTLHRLYHHLTSLLGLDRVPTINEIENAYESVGIRPLPQPGPWRQLGPIGKESARGRKETNATSRLDVV